LVADLEIVVKEVLKTVNALRMLFSIVATEVTDHVIVLEIALLMDTVLTTVTLSAIK
jgi:hypothetical protein